MVVLNRSQIVYIFTEQLHVALLGNAWIELSSQGRACSISIIYDGRRRYGTLPVLSTVAQSQTLCGAPERKDRAQHWLPGGMEDQGELSAPVAA